MHMACYCELQDSNFGRLLAKKEIDNKHRNEKCVYISVLYSAEMRNAYKTLIGNSAGSDHM
jgi:hypothetical protein